MGGRVSAPCLGTMPESLVLMTSVDLHLSTLIGKYPRKNFNKSHQCNPSDLHTSAYWSRPLFLPRASVGR